LIEESDLELVKERKARQTEKSKRMSQKFRVKLRRGAGWEVKPNAEQLDGKIYLFTTGFVIEDSSIYEGEMAFIPADENYPLGCGAFGLPGDLQNLNN